MDPIRRFEADKSGNFLVQAALFGAPPGYSASCRSSSRRRAGTCDDSACARTGVCEGEELFSVIAYIALRKFFQRFLCEGEFFLGFHLLPPELVFGNCSRMTGAKAHAVAGVTSAGVSHIG